MAGPITKELARKIIKKLGAVDETDPNDEHDLYAVYHAGELVASFQVRRASRKDIPHPHIPRDLRVNEHFTRELAYCPKTREDWLLAAGVVPPSEENEKHAQ
jgi:hypothetical protein